MTLQIIITIFIGYLLGCIQSAYLVSKFFGSMDIRDHGSGNAGASNIATIMGWKYAFAVAFIDALKGAVAVWLVKAIYPVNPALPYLAGIMAILGHNFPFHLKLRGGKGVATLVGMIFGLQFPLGFLFILLVIVPAFIADYIVAGSLTAFIALPIAAYFLGYETELIVISVLMTLLAFYMHRGNFQRIWSKEEIRISEALEKKKTGKTSR